MDAVSDLGSLIFRGDRFPVANSSCAKWELDALAGNIVELSAPFGVGARLTCAVTLIRDGFANGHPVIWISAQQGLPFPLDLHASGLPLHCLPFITAPSIESAMRALTYLMHGGHFGLIVVDLGRCPQLSSAIMARTRAQAHRHKTTILLLTEKDDHLPSASPLIGIRCVSSVTCLQHTMTIHLTAIKDKRTTPGWIWTEVFHAPIGLCGVSRRRSATPPPPTRQLRPVGGGHEYGPNR